MRLLLVDDDPEFAIALKQALAQRDVAVDVAGNGADADQLLETTFFAAIILDLGLPDEEGIALVRRWRGAGHSEPILVLSGRDGVSERVAALRAGADDYMIKPVIIDELHARLDAIVRRRNGFAEPSIRAGRLVFDTMARQLSIDGETLELSAREADIAEILIRRGNRATPRRLLEDQLFGAGDGAASNALEVYVHRLRRKIEDRGGVSIRTIRGIGYMLVAQ